MNNYIPKKAKDIKGPVAIAELRRAHLIIATLSIAFAVTVGFVSANEVRFDAALGATLIIFLVLLALISLGTIFMLGKRK